MKKYELLTIIRPNLDNEEVDKVIAKVEDALTYLGGMVFDTERVGRKKLAYEVQKLKDGFMVVQVIQIPADKIKEFRRQLKLNDNIIRVMLTLAPKVITPISQS